MEKTETELGRLKKEAQKRKDALDARRQNAPPPPSVQSLCLENSLYSPVQLNPGRDADYLSSLKFDGHQFDAHCVYCGRQATFRTFTDRVPEDVHYAIQASRLHGPVSQPLRRLQFEGGQFALHLKCTRNPNHLYSYFFIYDEKQSLLTKVGQTPSLEDVAGADIGRYRKILGDEFTEMRKATGLFAHGIGIGSFVYLRRIFESLVESARLKADPKGLREAEFKSMRMTDRIKELSDYLPPAVVKYRDTYGILSKGLHELSEDECKRYFPAVRAAVMMMLEQRYEALEKAKAAAELDRAVASIASEFKGKE